MQPFLQPEHATLARESLQFSQAKVANESGINRTYLSQFENGKRILSDDENDVLYEYYAEHGIDLDALIISDTTETEPDAKPENILSTESLATPVTTLINTVKTGATVPRIKDGMVIHNGLTDETTESLMAEYYQLDNTIVNQLQEPVSRTFLFNDIDEQQTFNTAQPLLLACYRQWQIKLLLQGRTDETDEAPQGRGQYTTTTIEQFLQQQFAQ